MNDLQHPLLENVRLSSSGLGEYLSPLDTQKFTTANTVATWLKRRGYTAMADSKNKLCHTACGLTVYVSGYVCRSKD